MTSIIAKNEPSIFISHVFPNKADKVETVFLELFGSCIDKVDIVKHKNSTGEDICRAYVHFKWWPSTPEACTLREKLLKGDSIKVVYEEPWFWKCVASKLNGTKGTSGNTSARNGPYIEVGDEHINRVVEGEREREYRGPPRESREYRGPPRESRDQYYQREREYRGPPRESREYRGPPRESRDQYYQREREYRGPPRESREYRGPPRESRDQYYQREREYRGPPRESRDQYHQSEREYRGPPREYTEKRSNSPRIIEESSTATIATEESKSTTMVPRQVKVKVHSEKMIVTKDWDKESTDDEGETIISQPKLVRQTAGAGGIKDIKTDDDTIDN